MLIGAIAAILLLRDGKQTAEVNAAGTSAQVDKTGTKAETAAAPSAGIDTAAREAAAAEARKETEAAAVRLAEEKKKSDAMAAAAKLKAEAEAAVKEKEREMAEAAAKERERQVAEAARLEKEKQAALQREKELQDQQRKAVEVAEAKKKAEEEGKNQLAATSATNPVVSKSTGVSASGHSEMTNSIGMVLVRLPSKIWVGKYEVTQTEYRKVMGTNPSRSTNDLRQPVERVTWNEAREFCRKLSEMERGKLPPGSVYSLPTEKQWKEFLGGQRFEDLPGGGLTGRGAPLVVGQSGVANKFGLFDVLGNVWEWCLDDATGGQKLLKGGAFTGAFFDKTLLPDSAASNCGFRCILAAP
jgi:formylglycine-generating enzyme required for sulfatase activity